MNPSRPLLTDPALLDALAHPVRLDVLSYLIAEGPATASVCARAVRDTPSNCSYHLRVLGHHNLVERDESADGRERPWKATITGFELDRTGEESPGAAAVMAATLQLDQRLVRDYLTRRDEAAPLWRESDAYSTYTLRVSPAELGELIEQLDALIRPLIAGTREAPPADAELVHIGLQAFPRSWSQ